MARVFVTDTAGWITVDIDASGPVLGGALDHEKAEAVVRCAVLLALSALAEGDAWPAAALRSMAAFMATMKDEVHSAHFA